MTLWETHKGKVAQLNGYAYGSMTHKKPEALYQDILSYFNIQKSELDTRFALLPPMYSQIRKLPQTSKRKAKVKGRD